MISDSYRDQLRAMHGNAGWGTSSSLAWVLQWANLVAEASHARTILDYGCGKGVLTRALREKYDATGYDPGMEEFAAPPKTADMLVCSDVLEHVEPEALGATLRECAALAPVALFIIAMGPARHVLPDGRDAHLIQMRPPWWEAKLSEAYPGVKMLWRDHYWCMFLCSRVDAPEIDALNAATSVPDRCTTEPMKTRAITDPQWRNWPLSKAYPAFTNSAIIDGKREAILCGTHTGLIDHADEIRKDRAPVLAIHKAAGMVGRCDLQLLCDNPEHYPPGVILDDTTRRVLHRVNYAPVTPQALRYGERKSFYNESDPRYADWLHLGWCWFKTSFPFALQLLYAFGIRRIRCYGVKFEPTPDSTEHQRMVYAQQKAWLDRQRGYFVSCGLEVVLGGVSLGSEGG